MGQGLGFAHCKEAPSTASSTPDSTPEATDGGNESDFPELHTAREFSEDEEETSLDWGTPRELTFSYITFAGSGTEVNSASLPANLMDTGAFAQRDSLVQEQDHSESSSNPRRARAPPGLACTDTRETLLPNLADSLENIPSLTQSPETEHRLQAGQSLEMSEPLFGWGMDIAFADDAEFPEDRALPNAALKKTSLFLNPHCGVEVRDSQPEVPDEKASAQLMTTEGQKEWDLTQSVMRSLGSRVNHYKDISEPRVNLTEAESWLWQAATPHASAARHRAVCHVTGSQRPLSTVLFNEDEDQPNWNAVFEEQQVDSEPSGEVLGMYIAVADLLYWRNTQTSAIVCTSLVVSLLCLSQFSIISVGSYVALLLLCATITLRVYRKALQAVNKSDGVNPFQIYLDEDVALSKEQVDKYVDRSLAQVTTAMKTLRHLFLVEDLVDSLKLLVLLYLFTYIGAVFNGLTLLILGVISAFSLPLLYRQHQAQIDQCVGLVRNQLSQIRAKIQAKLPSGKPKAE